MDLKVEKEKNYKMKEQLRIIEKNSNGQQQHMMKQQEQIRELLKKLEGYRKGNIDDIQIVDAGLNQQKWEEKTSELKRALENAVSGRERERK